MKQQAITGLGIFLCAFMCGCSQTPTLEFVVPDGYRGIVKLSSEQADGIELQATNGVLTLSFSNTGELKIKSAMPTREWHYSRARYANGKPIEFVDTGYGNTNSIQLRSVGDKSATETWFVVGTFEDLKAAKNQQDGFVWPTH